MVKTVLSVSHQGVRDWVSQRISAVIMAYYTLVMAGYFALHQHLTYMEWHEFMAQAWIKISTLLFIIAMLYHAWLGLWTVFTDYIKSPIVRLGLIFFTIIFLGALLLWGVLIVGSI